MHALTNELLLLKIIFNWNLFVLCMHMRAHVCMYICMCVYVHVSVSVCVCMSVCMYMCLYACVSVFLLLFCRFITSGTHWVKVHSKWVEWHFANCYHYSMTWWYINYFFIYNFEAKTALAHWVITLIAAGRINHLLTVFLSGNFMQISRHFQTLSNLVHNNMYRSQNKLKQLKCHSFHSLKKE